MGDTVNECVTLARVILIGLPWVFYVLSFASPTRLFVYFVFSDLSYLVVDLVVIVFSLVYYCLVFCV